MKYYHRDSNQHTIQVINDPKLNIDPALKDELIKECTDMAQLSFGSQNISAADVSRHILDSSTTLIAREESGKLCGFSSNAIKTIDPYHIIYFQSTVISNEYKRTGLHKLFLTLRIMESVEKIKTVYGCEDEDKILLGGRTQNPRICRRSRKNMGLFPSLDGFITAELKALGRPFAKLLYDEDCEHSPHVHPFSFDDEKFVARSAYKFATTNPDQEASLYQDDIPFSSDESVNRFMASSIDWANGDALVSLGYYKHDKVKGLLTEGKKILEQSYSKGLPDYPAMA